MSKHKKAAAKIQAQVNYKVTVGDENISTENVPADIAVLVFRTGEYHQGIITNEANVEAAYKEVQSFCRDNDINNVADAIKDLSGIAFNHLNLLQQCIAIALIAGVVQHNKSTIFGGVHTLHY